jgi:hypothetical protein
MSFPSAAPCSHSSYSDTLQPEDILKEPEDTVPLPENTLLQQDDKDSTMPGTNRSAWRDVHIFNASDRNTTIGGLRINNGITNANLYAMVEIFVFFNSEYVLRNKSNIVIERDNTPLEPGNYYIDSPSTSLSNNPFTQTNL